MDGKSDDLAEFAEKAQADEGTTGWTGDGAGGDETEIVESVTVQAETMTAWSEADDEPDSPRKPWRLVWGIVASVLVVCALVAIVVVNVLHKGNPTPTAGPAPAPPPATHAPPQLVLDGTYRLDHDNAKGTQNGAPNPQPNSDNTRWWAFRSSCKSTGCVATGTNLDKINHQVASTPADTDILHFADNHWQDSTPWRHQVPMQQCLGANGQVTTGEETQMVAWSFEPQADGTLKGVVTITVLTNECGHQGGVQQLPFVATRVGDVPVGVTVADPATVSPSATASIPARILGGPVLDGTFRVDSDNANQTANGVPVSTPLPNKTEWWALRSLCTLTGCVATGSKLADTNHQAAAGVPNVLHFADGHWQDTPYLQPPHQCAGTNGTDTETISWSFEPQPDSTLRGVLTGTVLTNECGKQGKVWRTPISVTRTGDVPPEVVVADPALF
jgi:serine/threonine-protein kinase